MSRVRVVTYNVHSCRGSDRRLDPNRILQVLRELNADVIALQELDVGQLRSERVDQTALLAEGLGMQAHFVSARDCGGGHYGNAILTRHASRTLRAGNLPRVGHDSEPRAAQWVSVEFAWGNLHVFNTHLALQKRERSLQAERLLGEEWLSSPLLGSAAVLCGDLNAIPGSPVYEALRTRMKDAQLLGPRARPRRTFPALLPFVRIDHVFVTRALRVERALVPADRLARLASDHRPLVIDVTVESGAS